MSARIPSFDDCQLELDDVFVIDGPVCRIRYGEDARGRPSAKEQLDNCKAERPHEYLSALQTAKKLATIGHSEIKNPERFKHLGGGLYEIKAHQLRLLLYPVRAEDSDKMTWYLLHALIKKTDALREQDVVRAKRLIEENDQRIKSKSSKK